MEYDTFVGEVQQRTHLSSRDEVERATRATLETLVQRMAGGEAHDLASQLPPEIGKYVQGERAGSGERFSLDEFFQRVSQREGVDVPEAVSHARAVIKVVNEAVSQGEINDVRAQLPADFAPLFEAGSSGRTPGAR
jgi:uncharacterized protein (DUF2267 family)